MVGLKEGLHDVMLLRTALTCSSGSCPVEGDQSHVDVFIGWDVWSLLSHHISA